MKNKKEKIILASASPRRKELLSPYYRLKVVPAHIQEKVKRGEPPLKFVKRISLDKWKKVSSQEKYKNEVVLAADTIVVVNKQILGKPRSKKDALKMLKSLSGKSHWVISSVVVGKASKKKQVTIKTKIFFRKLSVLDLSSYIKSGEWKGKAGAYAIQGKAMAYVDTIQGSLTSVIGLPLEESLSLIRAAKKL
jgi:septum formation protein